jgi:bifunctional non-homologous end joining protein LigD
VWTSRVPRLEYPDLCVFDLDPSEDEPAMLRAAALGLRDLLDEVGLPSWVKTTGSKGFHIVVPLDGQVEFGTVARFAHAAATILIRRDPEHLTLEFMRVDRGSRIFIDTGRNGYGATYAAPYAIRPKPHAPVSAPCTWAEIEDGTVGPQTFDLRTMPARLAAVGDLWGTPAERGQSLHGPTEQLRQMLPESEWVDDLDALYSRQRVTAMHRGLARTRRAREEE